MSNNVIIFGDSYSTFKGHIPEGFEPYYYPGGYSNGVDKNDVEEVSQTWWGQLIPKMNATLLLNNSWSGSTIGYTGYGNTDCSKSSSFIYRFNQLCEQGFFEENKIDTVFVFGGTNDSWCGAPIGELKFSDWSHEDLFSVLPAVSYFFKILSDKLPSAKIITIINSELNEIITNGLITASEHYGAKTVLLKDVEKLTEHPTRAGMQSIAEQVFKVL